MNALTKNIIVVVVGSVACFGIALFVLRPMLNSDVALTEELNAKKDEVNSLQQQIRAYQTAQSDLSKAIDKERISNALTIKEDLVKSIKSIEADSAQTSSDEKLTIILDPFLTVSAAQKAAGTKAPPTNIKNLSGITEVPFRLSITNSYSGMTDLFSYLEYLPNFDEITKFQLSAQVSEGSSLTNPVHTGQVLGTIDGVFFVNNNETSKP